jgi:hypothetical protein
MITKGYVISKSKDSPNKYLVRMPTFEPAGVGLTNNPLNTSISECTLSQNPGTYEALKPGDVVFVAFEDNRYERPVILGKLFVNIEEQSTGFQYNTDLRITHKATLPADTVIGNVPFDNILNYFDSLNTSIDRLDLAINSIPMAANLILYATSAPADISGYVKLVTSVEDPNYNTTPVDIPTGVINDPITLLASLITEPNILKGNPGVINITTIGNIKRTAGNNNQYAAFYFQVFKRDSLGNETLLATSNETPNIIIGNIYEEFRASAILNNGLFSSTDRIVIKYFANRTGNPGSNYDFQFGGLNPVRTLIPVPTSNIPIPKASEIKTDVGEFNNILSFADTDVQKALKTINDKSFLPSSGGNITGNLNVNGNVGIGTTGPQSKLELNKSTILGTVLDTPSIVLSNRNSTNTSFVHSGIFADTHRNSVAPHYSAGIWFTREPRSSNTSSNSAIIFGNQESNSVGSLPTERMRLTTGGNLGIGINNPFGRLHVSGTTYSTNFFELPSGNVGSGILGKWNLIVGNEIYDDYGIYSFTSLFGNAFMNSYYYGRQLKIIVDTENATFGDNVIYISHPEGVNVPFQYYKSESDANWQTRTVTGGDTNNSNLLGDTIGGNQGLVIELDFVENPDTIGMSPWCNARAYKIFNWPTRHYRLIMEGPLKLDQLRLNVTFDGDPASNFFIPVYLYALL